MLLLVKLKNAAELLWDSLDMGERMILSYFLVVLSLALFSSWRQLERERLVSAVRDQLDPRPGREPRDG